MGATLLLLLHACVLRVTGGGGADPATEVDNAPTDGADAASGVTPSAPGREDPQESDAEIADHAALMGLDAAAVDGGAGRDEEPGKDGALLGDTEGGDDGAIPSDAGAPDAAAQTCSLSGTFATELLFDVGWNQTTLAGIVPLLAAGTGKIRMVVRLDLGGTPENKSARLTACGATLPDFKASNVLIGTENYSAYIPESAWEHAEMPHPAFGVTFGCAAPGCALVTDHVVATFGARALPDDVWPGRSGPIRQITPLDHDADGHPGVTFVSRGRDERTPQGAPYVNIPVTWTLGARALEADVAFRITGMFTGKVDSCDLFTGVVGSGSVEARAVGCRAERENTSGTSLCVSEQTTFLDENLPAWQVRGGTFRARRVPTDASCSAVRAALQ